jgi:uncharacterized protein
LRRQLQSAQPQASSGSFLGNDPWAQPAANSAPVPGAGNYQTPRYVQQAAPQPQAASGGMFGGGSFLGNVATTAAGVVAGSFLFQGIENLMHHSSGFGGSGYGGSGFGQSIEEQITEQTVINNYYGDDEGQRADNRDYLVSDDSDYSTDVDDTDSDDSDWI